MSKKYSVPIRSCVFVEAESAEDAYEVVNDALRDKTDAAMHDDVIGSAVPVLHDIEPFNEEDEAEEIGA